MRLKTHNAFCSQTRLSSVKRQRWHSKPPQISNNSLPDDLRSQGSLTLRLQSQGKFSICLVQQGLALPILDEARALGLTRPHLAWVREALLLCDDKPRVFAHTVLPRLPRGPMHAGLKRLGTRSLGSLLFSRPGFTRGPLFYQRLDARHALFKRALSATPLMPLPTSLWARRSSFTFGTQSVLLTEVFLPIF